MFRRSYTCPPCSQPLELVVRCSDASRCRRRRRLVEDFICEAARNGIQIRRRTHARTHSHTHTGVQYLERYRSKRASTLRVSVNEE